MSSNSPLFSMAAPLGSLLSNSWKFFTSHLAAIAVGAAVVTALVILLQTVFVSSLMMPGRLRQMGIDVERVEELQQRAAAGDEAAADELEREMEAQLERMSPDKMGAFFMQVGPLFLLSFFAYFIVSSAAGVYYLLLVLREKSIGDTAAQATRYVFPIIGLWIWMFLRSFIWIPIIGIIPAVIIAPRLFLSGIILVQEQKGIIESARLSYQRTQGYWGKIVGNMIVASFIMWLGIVAAGIVMGMLIPEDPSSSFIVSGVSTFISQFLGAFLVIFGTKLGLSILGDTQKTAA